MELIDEEIDFRLRVDVSGRLVVGFFNSASEQAWIVVPEDYAGEPGWWDEAAETMRFLANTVGINVTNYHLAEDMCRAYETQKNRPQRAGRPASRHSGGSAAGSATREGSQGAGGSDGLP